MARSQSVIGFWLNDCVGRPRMLAEPLPELFAITASGELPPELGGEYPLAVAARAHEALRSRTTTGKLVLDPTH